MEYGRAMECGVVCQREGEADMETAGTLQSLVF